MTEIIFDERQSILTSPIEFCGSEQSLLLPNQRLIAKSITIIELPKSKFKDVE